MPLIENYSTELKTTRKILKRTSLFEWLLFFIIWPFGAFLLSIRRFKLPEARIVFWWFCIFLGFTFIVQENTIGTGDNARYAAQLEYMHNQGFSLQTVIDAIYNPADGYVDVYQPITTWIVAIFTPNPHWLFAVFALVFGFFYSKNIWLLLDYSNRKVSWLAILMVLSFALVNPIWNINGVRMWTAAQIFVYGALLYFLKDEKVKGLIWIICTPLVHFSFLFPVVLYLVFLIIPTVPGLFLIFFLVTSFINELDIKSIGESLSFMPQVFQPRITGYTNIDYVDIVKDQMIKPSWHVQFSGISSRIIIYTGALLIFLKRKTAFLNFPYLQKLYAIALFLGGWANLAGLVPSGGRFAIVSDMLFYACFVILIFKDPGFLRFQVIKFVFAFFLLFLIVFKIRTWFDTSGFLLFVGNPFFLLFTSDQDPIINYIKGLF